MKNKTKHIGITAMVACLLAIGIFSLIGCHSFSAPVETQLAGGNAFFEEEDYDMAIYTYNIIIKEFPKSPEAKIAREKLAEAREKIAKAKEQEDLQFNREYPSIAAIIARADRASVRTDSQNGNILNDIAWRDEWVKIFDDAKKLIQAHQPVIAQVIYDPTPKQGKIDYYSRTVDFECTINVKGVPYPSAYIKMVRELNDKLVATEKNGDQRRFESGYSSSERSSFDKGWNIMPLSLAEIWGGYGTAQIDYTAELVSSNGKVIAQTSEGVQEYIAGSRDKNIGLGYIGFGNNGTVPIEEGRSAFSGIVFNPRNNYSSLSYARDNIPLYPFTAVFTVKADDITDQMTVRLSVQRVWDVEGIVNNIPHTRVDFSKYPVEVMTTAVANR